LLVIRFIVVLENYLLDWKVRLMVAQKHNLFYWQKIVTIKIV